MLNAGSTVDTEVIQKAQGASWIGPEQLGERSALTRVCLLDPEAAPADYGGNQSPRTLGKPANSLQVALCQIAGLVVIMGVCLT